MRAMRLGRGQVIIGGHALEAGGVVVDPHAGDPVAAAHRHGMVGTAHHHDNVAALNALRPLDGAEHHDIGAGIVGSDLDRVLADARHQILGPSRAATGHRQKQDMRTEARAFSWRGLRQGIDIGRPRHQLPGNARPHRQHQQGQEKAQLFAAQLGPGPHPNCAPTTPPETNSAANTISTEIIIGRLQHGGDGGDGDDLHQRCAHHHPWSACAADRSSPAR